MFMKIQGLIDKIGKVQQPKLISISLKPGKLPKQRAGWDETKKKVS